MAIPLMALATLGAEVGTGLLGLNAQKKQAKEQNKLIQQQNQLAQQQLALQERLINLGLASTTDGKGNTTFYDPATNSWKTILSEQSALLENLSDQELIKALQIDAPLARGELLANAARRSREGGMADGALMEYAAKKAMPQFSGASIAAALRNGRTAAVNAAFDEMAGLMNKQALRSGITGATNAGAMLAKARANTIAQMMGNPELEGMQAAFELNNVDRNNTLSNYERFASRASGAPGFAAPQPNISANLTQALANQRGQALNAMSQGGQMIGQAAQGLRAAGPNQVFNPAEGMNEILGSILDFAGSLGGSSSGSKSSANKLKDWK